MITSELEIIFISYDEPNAEENYSDLLNKIPWAKRVHGVKGFDTAHKAAAEISETDYFITVDGDNKIFENFLEIDIDFGLSDYKNSVLSWNSRNFVNGLTYGNGGLKIWPKSLVKNMKTHEISENKKASIEFCWGINYIQFVNVYSINYTNSSPFQAFRAGFREGVKMTLIEGDKCTPEAFKDRVWYENYNRLMVWMNVGCDVDNGIWSMYGARLGVLLNFSQEFDYNNIRDYDWFSDFWKKINSSNPYEECKICGEKIRLIADIPAPNPDNEYSEMLKNITFDFKRYNPLFTERNLNELYRNITQ